MFFVFENAQRIFHNWRLLIAVNTVLATARLLKPKTLLHLSRKMQVMSLFCSTSAEMLWKTACPTENHVQLSECKSAFI